MKRVVLLRATEQPRMPIALLLIKTAGTPASKLAGDQTLPGSSAPSSWVNSTGEELVGCEDGRGGYVPEHVEGGQSNSLGGVRDLGNCAVVKYNSVDGHIVFIGPRVFDCLVRK